MLDYSYCIRNYVSSETLIFLTQKEIKMTNQATADGLRGVSRKVITAVIAFVAAAVLCATTAFAQITSDYDVDIYVDNTKYAITTKVTEPIEILSQANITLNDTDKLDISAFTAGKGGVIKVNRLNSINVEFNNQITSYKVYANTVGSALKEIGLDTAGAELNKEKSSGVIDGMVVKIYSAASSKLKADGETNRYAIVNGTVADLLRVAQIQLGADDYTEPSLDTQLTEDMSVKVNRVSYEEVTKTEKLKYKTVTKKDKKSYKGIEKVTTKGKNGTAKTTYKVKYVNGKATAKTVVDQDVVKEAKDKVVKVGTKKTTGAKFKSNGVTSKNGYKVGQVIKGRYTHYCACGICGSGTGRTASGKKVSNGMKNPYYIACNWLPMGSVVNIDGKNYTVVDRGGSSLSRKGRVDIFTPEGHKACYRYGTGSCTLTIMRLGW